MKNGLCIAFATSQIVQKRWSAPLWCCIPGNILDFSTGTWILKSARPVRMHVDIKIGPTRAHRN